MTPRRQLLVRHPASAGAVAVDVPSDLTLVEQAVEVVASHCLGLGVPARRVRFNLRTALAEALANAMIYGNGRDHRKFVRVRVEVASAEVRIHVQDQGGGFDPARLPDPTTPAACRREDGRGIFVIRHLVDGLEFNEKGNSLCMTLRLT